MIVSVAMDSDVEAARPWVEEASPTFITLVDQEHRLSALYNMVNVPQAVWIDEAGRIVRPTESGGSIDILREFDPALGGFPEEAQARAGKAKETYLGAVRDWAINGSNSQFAFSPEEVQAHLEPMGAHQAMAHTKFRLGFELAAQGKNEEAERVFAECRELHPDSWNIFRQTTEKLDIGIAAGEAFWEKVMSLGDKAYYKSIDMDGL
jgi:hypothetical protein